MGKETKKLGANTIKIEKNIEVGFYFSFARPL